MIATRKTFLVLTLLAGLLLSTGFGCKGLTAQQQAATKTVTLEYWTVFDDVDALQGLIDQYKAQRPYLTINLRQLRSNELYPRLVEALAEDRGPDIISVSNRDLRAFLTKLAPMPVSVQDTTVVIEKTTLGQQTVVNSVARAMLSPSQLDREYVQAVKNDAVIGGQIYGLPMSLDTMALFYNKDLLDRAGIPEPPKNWDEFQIAVKKLTKYDKKTNKILQSGAALGTGNNIPVFDDLLYVLFRQSNIAFTDSGGQAIFEAVPRDQDRDAETPSMMVMNFYTDFANPARDTYTWNEEQNNALDKFVGGSLGFFFGYSYHYPVIKARAPQLNLGILPLLQLNAERPVNVANYWLQTVVGKSKNQNEAWALIDFLAHSKATKTYLDQTGRPTALRAYIGDQSTNEELQPFVSQVLIADNWYRGRDYIATLKALGDMAHEWLQEAPNPEQLLQFRQDILNRAAAKINQTL